MEVVNNEVQECEFGCILLRCMVNANKILTEYHQKIIYLILQLIAAKLKTGYPHQLLSVSTPFFFQFFMDSVMSCLISDLSFLSAKASSL